MINMIVIECVKLHYLYIISTLIAIENNSICYCYDYATDVVSHIAIQRAMLETLEAFRESALKMQGQFSSKSEKTDTSEYTLSTALSGSDFIYRPIWIRLHGRPTTTIKSPYYSE